MSPASPSIPGGMGMIPNLAPDLSPPDASGSDPDVPSRVVPELDPAVLAARLKSLIGPGASGLVRTPMWSQRGRAAQLHRRPPDATAQQGSGQHHHRRGVSRLAGDRTAFPNRVQASRRCDGFWGRRSCWRISAPATRSRCTRRHCQGSPRSAGGSRHAGRTRCPDRGSVSACHRQRSSPVVALPKRPRGPLPPRLVCWMLRCRAAPTFSADSPSELSRPDSASDKKCSAKSAARPIARLPGC